MLTLRQLKIIPVLVFVAMLSFSVRLVEFGLGVSTLTGAAHAAKEEVVEEEKQPMEQEPAAGEAAMKEGQGVSVDDEAVEEKEGAKPKKRAKKDEEEIEWRDASDEDLDYSDVRMEMFGDLTNRRKALDQKERSLMTREALLKAAENELGQKFQELSQLRQQIEQLLDKQSEEEEQRVASLVKVYEGMKPKDAARIFDTLDLDVLVSVMSRMSERRMSPILASMNPERARTVTIMLAQEKQLPTLPNVQ